MTFAFPDPLPKTMADIPPDVLNMVTTDPATVLRCAAYGVRAWVPLGPEGPFKYAGKYGFLDKLPLAKAFYEWLISTNPQGYADAGLAFVDPTNLFVQLATSIKEFGVNAKPSEGFLGNGAFGVGGHWQIAADLKGQTITDFLKQGAGGGPSGS